MILCSLAACQTLEYFRYATYLDPNYEYSISHPRSWEVKEGGNLGAQVVFLAPEKNQVFRSNGNIVVASQSENDLRTLADQTISQLKFVLNNYEVISQVSKSIGTISEGIEIRGRYQGNEGVRIIRTILAKQAPFTYVFTFTCGANEDRDFSPIIKHMMESFRPAPQAQ
ncbi:MAG: hypothetical protein R3A11_02375 [Bdellovibrionota bacterium]